MLKQTKKHRNVIQTLIERETRNHPSPIRINSKILRLHIESDQFQFQTKWERKSKKPISYDQGYLFFDNYTTVYTVYGPKCQPTTLYKLNPGRSRERILDIIVYSRPVTREPTPCMCASLKCLCLKRYFVCLTKDQWLLQCDFETGALIKEMYVESKEHSYGFGYCDWNVYGEQFVLISRLCPDSSAGVVGYMSVFAVSPFKFKYMFEIKREVFGRTCKSVNVSERLLITAMGTDDVLIYSFEDVLKEGVLLSNENIADVMGTYPYGVKINLSIQKAPPVLFNVKCFEQSVQFGGYPYHCLFPKPKQGYRFILENLTNDNVLKGFIHTTAFLGETVGVSFHPDFSNRVLVQHLNSLHCHKIINSPQSVRLEETFVLKFPEFNSRVTSEYSSFGRKLKQSTSFFSTERSIFAMDYEDELDLIGILGVHLNDPFLQGFIKLFDSTSGKEVKTIELERSLNETSIYKFYFDLDIIVILESDFRNVNRAIVYGLSQSCPAEVLERREMPLHLV